MGPAPAWLDELPLEPGPPWVSMGTRGLDGDRWLVADDDLDRDLALKEDLLAERHGEVFAALDSDAVRRASAEVLRLVSEAIGRAPRTDLHPLDAAARLVQEDLCVLVLRDGAPHLDGGSVCFPSYWRLADKLGRPLADVHGPVPHYADELATKVDGFLARLRPDRIVWRRNWSIHDDPAYFLPDATRSHAAAEVPGGHFLRSERQTLRRVGDDAVVFTIRTQQVPLGVLAERPDLAHRMAEVITAWPADTVAYKAGHGALAAAGWLAAC